MPKVIITTLLLFVMFSCKEKDPFAHLDNDISSFDTYVKAHQSEVVKEWMYYRQDIKGRYVMFQNNDGLYMRHYRGDEKVIYSERIAVSNDTFNVAGKPGSFYLKSSKGNLKVYEGGKKVNILYNQELRS